MNLREALAASGAAKRGNGSGKAKHPTLMGTGRMVERRAWENAAMRGETYIVSNLDAPEHRAKYETFVEVEHALQGQTETGWEPVR